MKYRMTFLIPTLFFFIGCAAKQLKVNFVSVQDSSKQTYQVSQANYQDKDVSIGAHYVGDLDGSLMLQIRNKTSSKMKILWDEVVFVDLDGRSFRTIHSGVRFMARNEGQPPTTIAPQSIYEDRISNASNIEINDYRNWDDIGLLGHYKPTLIQLEDPNFLSKYYAEKIIGKSMQLLLALERDGKKSDYILNFKIVGYEETPLKKKKAVSN